MLDEWEKGIDIINTRKLDDAHSSLLRRLMDQGYYTLLRWLTQVPFIQGQSDFRLMDRTALNALLNLPERNKFLRGLSHWIGFSQTVIPYVVSPRAKGATKFTPRQLISLAIQGVLSFGIIPLRLVSVFGFLIAALAVCYSVVVMGIAIFATNVPLPSGWSSLVIGIYFLSGVQLVGIGVLGEYLGQVLSELRRRPIYIIRESSLSGSVSIAEYNSHKPDGHQPC
jgi:hypothetical protein